MFKFGRLYRYILENYDEKTEYVTAKKAQFLCLFYFMFGILMLITPLLFLLSGNTRKFFTSIIMTYPLAALVVVCLYAVRKKKLRTAGNIIGWATTLISTAGVIILYPAQTGTAVVFYQIASVAFGVFFCSDSAAIMFYIIGLASQIGCYFIKVKPVMATLPDIMQQSAVSLAVNVPVTLTCIFACGMASTVIVNRALKIMHD
ncbi:MAG: hypothetical protein ACRCUT_03050, partial [Spirochaetota bacterium]